jgi:hypothetical protein
LGHRFPMALLNLCGGAGCADCAAGFALFVQACEFQVQDADVPHLGFDNDFNLVFSRGGRHSGLQSQIKGQRLLLQLDGHLQNLFGAFAAREPLAGVLPYVEDMVICHGLQIQGVFAFGVEGRGRALQLREFLSK